VWITGTVGSGKTVLAEAISNAIEERGVKHALISIDWLAQSLPAAEDDPFGDRLAAQNLSAIWPNFVATGIRYAVIEGVIETPELHRLFRSSLPGADITVVRVAAPQPVVEQRINEREIGDYLERLLARSAELTPILETAAVEDFTVSNDGRPIQEVAAEVLGRLGWLAIGT
jgi:dephospho-CoA kinase